MAAGVRALVLVAVCLSLAAYSYYRYAADPATARAAPQRGTAPSQLTSTSMGDTATSSNTDATPDPSMEAVNVSAIYEPGHDVALPGICPERGKNLQVFIAVTSAPSHHDARMAVRQTWGHFGQRSDVAIAFILGATNDPVLEEALAVEAAVYSDVIRGRFVDSYNNLTLKTLSTLEWVNNYCSGVKFILKTDDDMFINVNRLLGFITENFNSKRTIFGRYAQGWTANRKKESKYYVSPQQYAGRVFPAFTTGPAYLMSQDVVQDLFTTAINQTYLKLEDVFITGIVAEKIGVKRLNVNEFHNIRVPLNACNIQKSISIHGIQYHEQFDLWKRLLDGVTRC